MTMDIDVNGLRVKFYLDTGAQVIRKKTFDYIGPPCLQKYDQVALMYNGQTATFIGKRRAVFKRRYHKTEDVLRHATRIH